MGDARAVRLLEIAALAGALLLASCGGGSAAKDGGGDGGGDAALPSDATGPAASLRAGLLGAWSLDGDGKDHSGKGLDLTVDGLSFPVGKFGKGAQFAGADGSPIAHRTVDDASLNLTTGDFTVSFWINFAKTGSPQFAVIKGYAQEQGWFVGWAQTVWGFGFPAPKGGTFADPNGSPGTGTFHHVVFERTDDNAQIFVDGKLLGGVSVQDRAAPGAAPLQIGGYSPGGVAGGQSVVDGVVDDVAIWGRALDATERAWLDTHAVP
jgi:hypothetical protein